MLPTPYIKNLDHRVYEPSEDSFLLLDCLEECASELQLQKFPTVCEIGGGSGIVSTFLKVNLFPHGVFFVTDINPSACKTILSTVAENDSKSRFNSVDSLQMSLTSGLRGKCIDVLVFNPPYVPAEEVPELPKTEGDDSWLDLALLGGSDGMVVTWEVLLNLEHILSDTGVAYILFCARNNPDSVAEVMRNRGWEVKVIETRKAGWEVLSVLQFKKSP